MSLKNNLCIKELSKLPSPLHCRISYSVTRVNIVLRNYWRGGKFFFFFFLFHSGQPAFQKLMLVKRIIALCPANLRNTSSSFPGSHCPCGWGILSAQMKAAFSFHLWDSKKTPCPIPNLVFFFFFFFWKLLPVGTRIFSTTTTLDFRLSHYVISVRNSIVAGTLGAFKGVFTTDRMCICQLER